MKIKLVLTSRDKAALTTVMHRIRVDADTLYSDGDKDQKRVALELDHAEELIREILKLAE